VGGSIGGLMQYNHTGFLVKYEKNDFGDFIESSKIPIRFNLIDGETNKAVISNGEVVVYDIKIIMRGTKSAIKLVDGDFKIVFNGKYYKPVGIYYIYSHTGNNVKYIDIELVDDKFKKA
jgi:hypothetical protein